MIMFGNIDQFSENCLACGRPYVHLTMYIHMHAHTHTKQCLLMFLQANLAGYPWNCWQSRVWHFPDGRDGISPYKEL